MTQIPPPLTLTERKAGVEVSTLAVVRGVRPPVAVWTRRFEYDRLSFTCASLGITGV